jgi:hypothetical protein
MNNATSAGRTVVSIDNYEVFPRKEAYVSPELIANPNRGAFHFEPYPKGYFASALAV